MQLNFQNTALSIMENGSFIAGERIAVNPRIINNSTIAVLRSFPNEPSARSSAVRVFPVAEVPEQTLLISEELAASHDLLPADRARWNLDFANFDYQTAHEIILEVTFEQSLEQVIEQLNRSDNLGGRLLWFSGDSFNDSNFIEINDKPYKIREIVPTPVGRDTIIEITEKTNLKVFSPGYTAGIDIVVLADCSGSMSIADLTETADAIPTSSFWQASASRELKRDEALRRSLKKLLETRLRTTGRMSRIALVSFTHETQLRFPRLGGMIEFDETTPEKTVGEFRDAINLLRAEQGGTDIGNALHYAAELLYKHGRPGNDRLLVLISDGADWKPKGQDATGEIVVALQDPVSLMEHLHSEMKIHLHAIGISTREIYTRYHNRTSPGRTLEPSLVPNHELLERLVSVGGGDPSQTGNMDVLEQYLSGLGAGVTRNLKNPRSSSVPKLSDYEIFSLKNLQNPHFRTQTSQDVQNELLELRKKVKELFNDCNEYTKNTIHRWLFGSTMEQVNLFDTYLVEEVQNRENFKLFIDNIYKSFYESLDSKIKNRKIEGDPRVIEFVTDKIHQKLRLIKDFRNNCDHDKDSALNEDASGDSRQKARSDKKRLVEHYQKLVGVSVIEENDRDGWSRLQRSIINYLSDLLFEIRDIYRHSEKKKAGIHVKAEKENSKEATDFVLKW